jgi:hypothetical protein
VQVLLHSRERNSSMAHWCLQKGSWDQNLQTLSKVRERLVHQSLNLTSTLKKFVWKILKFLTF